MKYGQFIENNMRNNFIEKSFLKYGGKASPRPFYKKSKFNISLDQQSEMLYSLFLLCSLVEVYQNIFKTKVLTACFDLHKAFSKKQRDVWN